MSNAPPVSTEPQLASEQKAREYRARELEAAEAAKCATLIQLKEKHRSAAAAWADLADAEETRARRSRSMMKAVAVARSAVQALSDAAEQTEAPAPAGD
jgi:hypothetical protein